MKFLAPLTEVPAGGGTLKVPATDWFNVKDYGAKGDDATNDYTAIANAITAVPSTGGVLYFPPGTYRHGTALPLKTNLTIMGAGVNASILKQTSTAAHGMSGTDVHTVTLKDIQLQGPASGTGSGVVLLRSAEPNVRYLSFENVYIRQFGVDGIEASNCIVSRFNRVVTENNGRHGFYFHGVTAGAAGTSVVFNGSYANTNTTTGFNLYNMVYSALVGCASEGQPTNYLIDTCQSVTLVGSGSEVMTSGGTGFKITGGFCNTLSGCWDLTNRGKAFWLTGSTYANNLMGLTENTPGAGATASLQVDAGCTGINLHTISNSTPMSLAAGTTNILNDGSNGVTLHGYLYTDAASEFNGTVAFDQVITAYAGARLAQIATPTAPAAGVTAVYPKTGDRLYTLSSGGVERPVAPGMLFAFSKTGTLATGTGTYRIYNDTGDTLTIRAVRASVGTAPTGAAIIVDINKSVAGTPTTIFSTQGNRPTIAASSNTSGKVTNMNTTSIADGEFFTVDIDQVGSTAAGADLTVQILCG